MRHAARWAVTGAAALVVGALAWWLMVRDESLAPAVSVPALVVAPLPMPAASTPGDVVKVVDFMTPTLVGASPDKDFVEVCGIGKVRRGELELREGESVPAWLEALMNQQSEQAMSDLLKRLDAGSTVQRVVAAVLRGDTQQAAVLAATSSEVDGYRLAMRACRTHAALRQTLALMPRKLAVAAGGASTAPLPDAGPEPTACAALSIERLQALDANDAWPWLLRLSESTERKDDAGVIEALYQIGRRDWPPLRSRVLGAAVAPLIGDEPTPADAMAMVAISGVDAASGMEGGPFEIGKACRANLLRDANRRQLCEQAARRMPGMTVEILDATMLHSLEDRLGLPHSPQAMSSKEMSRVSEAMIAMTSRMLVEPSCANVTHAGQQFLKLLRVGELAYGRAAVGNDAAFAPR